MTSRITYVCLIFLSGCTTIHFERPQPSGTKALEAFPGRYQGTYVAEEDTIYIHEKAYNYPEVYEKNIPVHQLDTINWLRMADNLIYDSSLPVSHGIPFDIRSDTLHYRVTLRMEKRLSDSLVLKIYKDYLVMNEKEKGQPYWNVYLLKQGRDKNIKLFLIGNYKTREERETKAEHDGVLDDFYPITEFKKIGDRTYLVDPTRRQFQKLVKKDFWRETGELRSIP